jgi:hypothetical protein
MCVHHQWHEIDAQYKRATNSWSLYEWPSALQIRYKHATDAIRTHIHTETGMRANQSRDTYDLIVVWVRHVRGVLHRLYRHATNAMQTLRKTYTRYTYDLIVVWVRHVRGVLQRLYRHATNAMPTLRKTYTRYTYDLIVVWVRHVRESAEAACDFVHVRVHQRTVRSVENVHRLSQLFFVFFCVFFVLR